MKSFGDDNQALQMSKKAVLSNITRSKVALQAVLVGLIAGIIVVLFRISVESVEDFVRYSVQDLSFIRKLFFLPVIGGIGGLLAGLLIYKIAPETTGSGIPYVKLALARIGKEIRLRSILVKFFAGVSGIGTGLSLGREGPSVQLGSGAGALVAKMFKMSGTDRDKLVAAGAGSAIGATFNAPIAATIFVLEELIHTFSSSLLFPVLIATTTAAAVSRYFVGDYPAFIIPASKGFINADTLPAFVVLGLLSGFLGVAFSKSIIKNIEFFDSIKAVKPWHKVAIAGVITGLVGVFIPYVMGPGNMAIEELLHGKYTAFLIFIILVAKFFLSSFCFGSGAAGGIFLPTLMLGAFTGYLTGLSFNGFLGADLNLSLMALIGMGAFLSAVVRTPITAVVIVFEMTGNYQNILPIMLCAAIADLVAERLESPPIYSSLIFRQGMTSDKATYLGSKKVKDKMIKNVESIKYNLRLAECIEMIKTTLHCGFPVVSEDNTLLGLVTKSAIEDATIQGTSPDTYITKFMDPSPFTIHEYDNLYNALLELHVNNVAWLIVVDDEQKVKGIITRFDLKNAINDFVKQKATPVAG